MFSFLGVMTKNCGFETEMFKMLLVLIIFMINRDKIEHVLHEHRFDKFLIDFVTVVSILYMLVLIVESYVDPGSVNFGILVFVDTLICVVFLFEFFYFFFKARSKSEYFKVYFFDFLASLPFLLLVSIGPLISFLSFFKVLRGVKNVVKVYEFASKKRFSVLGKVVVLFFLFVIYFSIVIVSFEQEINAGLATFHDGVWWTVSTITSVGYGDVTPETYTGKFVATILMVFGIGLSSAMGALFVMWLLKPSQERLYGHELKIEKQEEVISEREEKIENTENKILRRLDEIEEEISEISERRGRRKRKRKD